MHPRERATAPFLVALVLLAGLLLAGCGGGDGGSGGSGDGAQGGDGGSQGGNAPQSKVAIGEVISVKPDRDKIVVRKAAAEGQDGERVVFKVKKNANVTLAGKKAELSDAKEGQQAQIEYVVSEEKSNRASEVQLFEGGG